MKQIGALTIIFLCLAVAVHAKEVGWVTIPGGQYVLGTPDFGNSQPIPGRSVTIETLEISRTLVTVEQYKECMTSGRCTNPDPDADGYCNWEKSDGEVRAIPGREKHPANCVDWYQANMYAKFSGARLLTESEWEYAARSGGKNQKYPWGNEEASCERAVMYGKDAQSGKAGYGCGNDSTMPVCSKSESALGLCDVVGHVWQWVQDSYENTYAQTPADGKAHEGSSDSDRVVRGGSFYAKDAGYLRADRRYGIGPGRRGGDVGFRLARVRRD